MEKGPQWNAESRLCELIASGADISALEKTDEFPRNAYLAATTNGKHEVVDFLKSLGVTKPKPVISKPLIPGVKVGMISVSCS